jgi:hypothetical protein
MDRRNFLQVSPVVVSAAALLASRTSAAQVLTGKAAPVATQLHWLDEGLPASFEGTSFGIPWPSGALQKQQLASLRFQGTSSPQQAWPLAYWPDGSIKWSGHALAPAAGEARLPESITLDRSGSGGQGKDSDWVSSAGKVIRVDTGKLRCTLNASGVNLFESLVRQGAAELGAATLVVLTDTQVDAEDKGAARSRYVSQIRKLEVESSGPARAVIKAEGEHVTADGGSVLPFVVRLYFYRNSDALRIVHSFVNSLDERQEAIRGIGLRFAVPLAAPLQERYVRFVSDNGGVFAEAVLGLTGLRRDPGKAVREAQLQGLSLPAIDAKVTKNLQYIPAFGNYSLLQAHPDGFTISKRTAPGTGWIHSATGARAAGVGYLGTPSGGVVFGVRNFWQSYPGQLDIEGAATEQASVTLWLWAPRASGMDMRFYHDGLGQTEYAKQLDGLDITYEDYEPEFGRPYGVARTSEIEIQLTNATPTHARLVELARRIQNPPRLTPPPERLEWGQAFSDFWAAAQKRPAYAELERQLDWCFQFYRKQVDERSWYGFWDYGDVMHTYDEDRHVWRYDVGGFAWDNSELSTEIWLWHYFLHTGRAEVFRMAEAMTRHVSEVDVHHIGPYAPLGSRHNVQHWGDSAKQLRISTAINRRFYYYLSTDERTGDLLHEQVDAVQRLQQIIAGRKVGQKAPSGPDAQHLAAVSFGTDWGAIAAAWLTEWERTGNEAVRVRLAASMHSIAQQPHGFSTGGGFMDLRTGAFQIRTDDEVAVSHLSAAFGLAEVCSELINVIPDPAFRDAWLQYCVLYNADAAEQKRVLGVALKGLNLGQGHAKLLGYAGKQLGDREKQQRAWQRFFAGHAGQLPRDLTSRRVTEPAVLHAVDEAPALSTNGVAQWALALLCLLSVAPDALPQ